MPLEEKISWNFVHSYVKGFHEVKTSNLLLLAGQANAKLSIGENDGLLECGAVLFKH